MNDKLNILNMYPDFLNVYSDSANLKAIEYRAMKRGIDCKITVLKAGDAIDLKDYNLIFMGDGMYAGADAIRDDIFTRKEEIIKAIDAGCCFFLIGSSFEMFGSSYVSEDGKELEGLGICDYKTLEPTGKRAVGNILVDINCSGKKISVLGFENHATQIEGVTSPLGEVRIGSGNVHAGEGSKRYEGYIDDNIIATSMHGPVLIKNAGFTDFIIKKALKKDELEPLESEIEDKAFEMLKKRLTI